MGYSGNTLLLHTCTTGNYSPRQVPAGVIVPMIVVPPLDVTLIRSRALAISFLLFLLRFNQVPRSLLLFCKV